MSQRTVPPTTEAARTPTQRFLDLVKNAGRQVPNPIVLCPPFDISRSTWR
jgi:hypothetical protein